MTVNRISKGVSVGFVRNITGLLFAALIASVCHADYQIDGMTVNYTANTDGQYLIDSKSESSRDLAEGESIQFAINQSFSVRGETFKESFTPAAQVANLNRLPGFSLPPSVHAQTLFYQYFNGAVGVPVCRALVVDPGLAPASAVPATMKRLLKSLQANSVEYQLATGHLVIDCQSR
ncbi:hypothetical protein [Candidatus Thalassolituus haligoni]|uniref:hypothetical protein n=1 Tax=Candidatus Thalassolituus haligoni TaxID=3100113 RepID=UPI0035148D76|tara:strand:+ start:7701 stop:8231 length:531 start_codon:yes stop_codon:yes gene_type:complete